MSSRPNYCFPFCCQSLAVTFFKNSTAAISSVDRNLISFEIEHLTIAKKSFVDFGRFLVFDDRVIGLLEPCGLCDFCVLRINDRENEEPRKVR